MNEQDDQQLRELIRRTIAPVPSKDLRRDLWPELQRKLNGPVVRMPWFDRVLLAAVVLVCLLFPKVVFGLLYHL